MNSKSIKIAILQILLLTSLPFFAQNYKKIDSICAELKRETHDSTKINLLLSLGDQFEYQIEQIHEELTDSIHYANRIQKAVLLSENDVQDKMQREYFILFKPKDIVSGDFYYVDLLHSKLIVAVADCTGHGVPGAFMSILGISLLNEIIKNEANQSACEVLNELRRRVVQSLQQKGLPGEQKDGMDISLVIVNTKTNEIQFSGANNNLLYISSESNELCEIKGDKMLVAIYEIMKEFANHTIQLQKGDIFYLMSDGYADQFGGPKRRKFLSKNLKQLIRENKSKTMKNQKDELDRAIENWKNISSVAKYEQTDDITILGIKV